MLWQNNSTSISYLNQSIFPLWIIFISADIWHMTDMRQDSVHFVFLSQFDKKPKEVIYFTWNILYNNTSYTFIIEKVRFFHFVWFVCQRRVSISQTHCSFCCSFIKDHYLFQVTNHTLCHQQFRQVSFLWNQKYLNHCQKIKKIFFEMMID